MAQVKTTVFVPEVVMVTTLKNHDLNAFYRTRSGLWVSDDFRRLVVAKAKPTEASTEFKLKPRSLGRDATDKEIEDELQEMLGKSQHLFDETQVCSSIAILITKQASGENGELVNNGFANLFYRSSSVVRVSWYGGIRKWHVSSWKRGFYRWVAGDRVFSPGN